MLERVGLTAPVTALVASHSPRTVCEARESRSAQLRGRGGRSAIADLLSPPCSRHWHPETVDRGRRCHFPKGQLRTAAPSCCDVVPGPVHEIPRCPNRVRCPSGRETAGCEDRVRTSCLSESEPCRTVVNPRLPVPAAPSVNHSKITV